MESNLIVWYDIVIQESCIFLSCTQFPLALLRGREIMDRYKNIIDIVGQVIDFVDTENAYCYEIGEGKVNYVYRVEDVQGNSVIAKHADKLIRGSEKLLLSTHRSEIEYSQMQAIAEIVPNFVPKIYHYDKDLHMIIMEDLKEYEILREALIGYKTFPNFAAQISRYLFDTLFRTTDIVVPSIQKKAEVKNLINPEMCALSERVIFTEPYHDTPGENEFMPQNADFVWKNLYENEALKAEVGFLKYRFKNLAQSMLHGDLHTGSIFINKDTIKIFDPEYAFYGPMGFDIGTLIGNLFFPWMISYVSEREGKEEFTFWIEETIERILFRFKVEYDNNYEALVTDPMAKFPALKEKLLDDIRSDTYGYAGTEIIARTIGSAKVHELKMPREPEQQILLERLLIMLGEYLVMNRTRILHGKQLCAEVRKLVDYVIQDHANKTES